MFTVKITKTTIEERPAGKEWEVVKGCRADKDREYGYTPEIVKKREVELKVYEQTVDKINIKAVIEAVNLIAYSPEILVEESSVGITEV